MFPHNAYSSCDSLIYATCTYVSPTNLYAHVHVHDDAVHVLHARECEVEYVHGRVTTAGWKSTSPVYTRREDRCMHAAVFYSDMSQLRHIPPADN